jgi:hypothetical protein
MTDLRDTLTGPDGWFGAIVNKIPFYKGYKDKELRREADSLLRDHLAAQLSQQLSRAEDVGSQMLTGPGMMQLDDIGQANTRLQTLIDKVKTAAQGYAGLLDAVKIQEEELDLLYEFDHNMLTKVDEIGEAIEAVQAAVNSGDGEALPATVRRYTATVTEASALFDRRKETILGLS